MASLNSSASSPVSAPQTGNSYTIRQGDCLDSISYAQGFFWETIWNDASNRELKGMREDPFVLLPGDRIHIPSKRLRRESGRTEKRHRYRRKGVPSYLRITVLKESTPQANETYQLSVDGNVINGVTDAQGRLKHPIAPNARRARLTLPKAQLEYVIDLGHMDPIDTLSGLQERLRNLGIYSGPVDGIESEELHSAIAWFQEKHDLSPTGNADEAARKKLKDTHGS